MTRLTSFSSPLLLGFDSVEKTLEQIAKSGDSYPPYNIERLKNNQTDKALMRLRITLAVAGFDATELDVTLENNQLIIKGRHVETGEQKFLHRGIATQHFQRIFVLADGVEVEEANLKNGLLSINLVRLQPEKQIKKIAILAKEAG